MTLEIALWAIGVSLLPLLTFCVWVGGKLRSISEDTCELVAMHRSPDAHGFGTGGLITTLRSLIVAVEGLTYYTRWSAEKITGEKPPPFIPTIDHD